MKNCHRVLISIVLPTAVSLAQAQAQAQAQQNHPQYDAVWQVITQFFDGINTGNGELLASLQVDGARILNSREEQPGGYALVQRDWFDADNFDGSSHFTERYWDEQLLVSAQLAVFWAPYDFYIDGEFSHCGIDVLNLIRKNGEWKIGHAMWTIQRSGCTPSPLGPLARETPQ